MIDDPYNEFFVEEFGEGCQLEQVQRKYELVYDTYWEKRYSLNIQQVGSVLSLYVLKLYRIQQVGSVLSMYVLKLHRNFFVVYRSTFCSAPSIRLFSLHT